MGGFEVFGWVSAGLNVLGAIAGCLGWKRYQTLRRSARQVERTGEVIIQGVEACEKVLGGTEAKQVKRSVRAVAEAAGCQAFLHRWLVKLGLADEEGGQ